MGNLVLSEVHPHIGVGQRVRLILQVAENAELAEPGRQEGKPPEPLKAAMGLEHLLLKIAHLPAPHASRKTRQWATNVSGYWNSAPWPESG